MKHPKSKRILSLLLSAALLVSTAAIGAGTALAADKQRFLTDENGVPQSAVGKVAAQNHEIIDVNVTDGEAHQLSIYLLDEDNSGRWSMVDVIDPQNQKLLDSQNVFDFGDGVYLKYEITGHVQIRLTNVWTNRYTQSKDTAVYGVFLDGADAIESGDATVTTTEAAKTPAANQVESFNILGKYAAAGETYAEPFNKEVQSIEIRFNGNVDPKSENIDKITVTKDGEAVSGEMRTSFNSVTFKPESPMRAGDYTVTVPQDVQNTAGQSLQGETTLAFEVAPKVEVTYFNNAMNLMTRRVDLSFNDRLSSSPMATLIYDPAGENQALAINKSGSNGGLLFEIEDTILPSGKYVFTLPAGVKSVSGAVSEEDYVKEFDFESSQLSAEIDMPNLCQIGDTFTLSILECYGYGEIRYAFSQEELNAAEYQPVAESFTIDPGAQRGDTTFYVQFRVKAGEKAGEESPLLHKAINISNVAIGEMHTFDMDAAGAYDKDGFARVDNKTNGVFDLATDEWSNGSNGKTGTSNYIVDGSSGFGTKYDPDGDAKVTTEDGIEYQLSKNIYVDDLANMATGNGRTVPVPVEAKYSDIYILGAGKGDSEKGTFTMNYADGTSTTQEVEMNYWGSENAPKENIVFSGIACCLGWSGEGIYAMAVMRQYVLKPDPEKVLVSVTLPNTTALVRTMAMTGKEVDTILDDPDSSQDVTAYSEGSLQQTAEESDMSYDEFVKLYGDDEEMMQAADVTEVTDVPELTIKDPDFNEDILAEKETVSTGGYGDSLYPYARQPEKLMSYKIRMQSYENYELTFEDALETIRRVDNFTRGLEKKCYLVGWQVNGHDTGYPYFNEVNPRHKRSEDETSLESLKWLMQEAKKYNTTITLHVNLSDTYTDDNPLGQQMLENGLAMRQNDGSVRETSKWSGHTGFMTSAYSNYFTGNLQQNQMGPLLEMLPELAGQSVHPDAWYTYPNTYMGQTGADIADAKRRTALYMRETYNMDLTTEFEGVFNSDTWNAYHQDYVLYFPMIWQHGWNGDEIDPMKVPAYFQSGVNEVSYNNALNRTGRYFGEGTSVESLLWANAYSPIEIPELNKDFAQKELTRQYLNTLLRVSLEDDIYAASYSTPVDPDSQGGVATLVSGDGQKVTSAWNGNNDNNYKRTVTVGDDVILQEPGNVFMPMVWRANREIQAWSENGFTDRTWKLPVEWEGVPAVDVYDLSVEGLRHQATLNVSDRSVTFSLTAGQTVVIVPAGQDPNSQDGFETVGTVKFLGRDTETGGDWTKTYGAEGYDIFNGESHLGDSVEISYANGTETQVNTGYVKVESLTLSETDLQLKIGEVVQLTATIAPQDATEQTVTWESSNPEVAYVSQTGNVSAMSSGTATITATCGGVSAACEVRVESFAKSLLKETIDKAEEIKKAGYEEHIIQAVVDHFEKALENAWAVFNNEDAADEDILKADEDLILSMHYLLFTANPAGLQDAIAHAKEVIASGQYENDQKMQAYKDALAEAEAVLADETSTDTEYNAAIEALKAAEEELNKVVVPELDLSILQRCVNLADTLYENLEKYIDNTAKETFVSVYQEAKTMLEKALAGDASITQSDVDDMALRLNKAMGDLRLIPNKEELKKLLEEAMAKDLSLYTSWSVAALKEAVETAQKVYSDPLADTKAVEKAVALLDEAIDGLVLIDNSGEAQTPDDGNDSETPNAGENEAELPTGDATPFVALGALLLVSTGAAIVVRRRR